MVAGLVRDGAGFYDTGLATQGQTNHWNELSSYLYRDGDVHLVLGAHVGDHCAVEFFAIDADNQLFTAQATGNNIKSLALGTIKKLAAIGAANLVDFNGHRLGEHANAAGAIHLHAGFGNRVCAGKRTNSEGNCSMS